ncbi:MAG TPA: hypothetical protein VFS58_08705 [Steroidobacteraceae bacterium]|nr:hypothetical protein [Steroidobacteraceae bacterium]
MEGPNEVPADASADAPAEEEETGTARALTIHLLRMFETRMEAAGIALQAELQSFSSRLQLRVLAGAALFIALWGGVVLLAIALPEHLRIPVLAAVIAAFVIVGAWALLAAKRAEAPPDIGSMSWFLDGLRLDLEVLSRSLTQSRAQRAPPPAAANEPSEKDPNDLAA